MGPLRYGSVYLRTVVVNKLLELFENILDEQEKHIRPRYQIPSSRHFKPSQLNSRYFLAEDVVLPCKPN